MTSQTPALTVRVITPPPPRRFDPFGEFPLRVPPPPLQTRVAALPLPELS